METGSVGGQMLLQVEKIEDPRGFRLVGELDASNVGMLSSALERAASEGGDLTLDLGGLAFMDSSGIQVLIKTAQDLHGSGSLILASPGDLVRRILSLIPMDKLENVRIVDEDD
jgi:stage II sporulation protein AA (anti-sigma F factor antagonist)